MNNRELSTLNGFQHSAAILQWLMLAVAVCFTPALAAQGSADGRMDPGNYFRERADIRKYAVILTGPSVGEETTSRFRQWSFPCTTF